MFTLCLDCADILGPLENDDFCQYSLDTDSLLITKVLSESHIVFLSPIKDVKSRGEHIVTDSLVISDSCGIIGPLFVPSLIMTSDSF